MFPSFTARLKKQEDQIAIRDIFSKNKKSMTPSSQVIYRAENVKILEEVKRKPKKKTNLREKLSFGMLQFIQVLPWIS
jgi:hypothetical protein